jgi:hypothetical protein
MKSWQKQNMFVIFLNIDETMFNAQIWGTPYKK